jgi:hypothetical protein
MHGWITVEAHVHGIADGESMTGTIDRTHGLDRRDCEVVFDEQMLTDGEISLAAVDAALQSHTQINRQLDSDTHVLIAIQPVSDRFGAFPDAGLQLDVTLPHWATTVTSSFKVVEAYLTSSER